jgi:hypothetical protein
MSIREQFIRVFGEEQADRIETAAREHGNGTNDANLGSDPFKWALCICIGYQCMEVDRYRDHHGITAPWEDLKAWMVEHADLGTHDGDVDYLTAACGGYGEFITTGGEA